MLICNLRPDAIAEEPEGSAAPSEAAFPLTTHYISLFLIPHEVHFVCACMSLF